MDAAAAAALPGPVPSISGGGAATGTAALGASTPGASGGGVTSAGSSTPDALGDGGGATPGGGVRDGGAGAGLGGPAFSLPGPATATGAVGVGWTNGALWVSPSVLHLVGSACRRRRRVCAVMCRDSRRRCRAPRSPVARAGDGGRGLLPGVPEGDTGSVRRLRLLCVLAAAHRQRELRGHRARDCATTANAALPPPQWLTTPCSRCLLCRLVCRIPEAKQRGEGDLAAARRRAALRALDADGQRRRRSSSDEVRSFRDRRCLRCKLTQPPPCRESAGCDAASLVEVEG